MKSADYFYKCFVCYDPKILEPKVHKDNVLKAIDVAVVEARMEERRVIIYVLQSDIADNKDGYPKEYVRALRDEIKNHKMVITDLKAELKKLIK